MMSVLDMVMGEIEERKKQTKSGFWGFTKKKGGRGVCWLLFGWGGGNGGGGAGWHGQ